MIKRTLEYKINVMQAALEDKAFEHRNHGKTNWHPTNVGDVAWNWALNDYRISPMTVNEAALDYARRTTITPIDSIIAERSFLAGAIWQKASTDAN